MTNSVIVQSEHFLLVAVQLNHCSALVLVSLEHTAHLGQKKQTYKCLTGERMHTDADDDVLTCPLCSPRTTMTVSPSLLGTTVSSMSCFTSDRDTRRSWAKTVKKQARQTHQRLTVYDPSLFSSTHARRWREDVFHQHLRTKTNGFQLKLTVK